MNLKALTERLHALETAGRANPQRDAAETRQILHVLATDPEIGKLYNEALAVTSRLTCPHTRHGWCRRCLAATPTVESAWQAVAARMTELESLHTHTLKEYTQ